jgi:acyl carrier protein
MRSFQNERLTHGDFDAAFFLDRISVKTGSGIYAKDATWLFNDADAKVRSRWLSRKRVGRFYMQGFDSNIRDRIVSLVKAILEQNEIAAEVTPVARLVDVGLTSMDMVNLMLSVEAEFDFTIPQDQITPENFQSVETLERMVAGQLRQAA